MSSSKAAQRLQLLPPYLFAQLEQKIADKRAAGSFDMSVKGFA